MNEANASEGGGAGPALDLLIAEKVMGWSLYHYTKSPKGHWEWLASDPPIRIACGSVRGYFTRDEALADWQPSTDIGHAFEVVHHLRHLRFSVGTYGHDNEEWGAYFDRWSALAETLPLAICHAALLAADDLVGKGGPKDG